jgi:hypothetical protein
VPLKRVRCFSSAFVESSKKSPGNSRSGAVKPGFRNGYLVVFIFELLWLLADMYMFLWCP